MGLLDDLRKTAETLDPAAKPLIVEISDVVGALVDSLEAAGVIPSIASPVAQAAAGPSGPADPPPAAASSPQVEAVEQQLAAKQDQVATVAGSEQALTDPASVQARVNELHDQIQSLQIQLADLQRAELDVDPPPPDAASSEPPPAA